MLADGHDAYWFIADPIDVVHLPGSGSLDYGGNHARQALIS
ncbi:MAG: hypothetical protein O3C29_05435 [Proteobacteria bacterium]|nr:hypothetical protein [Pseudomonadota bacterium]MDA1292024.1 hypothetical protein [Pseudomonadota bacterium]